MYLLPWEALGTSRAEAEAAETQGNGAQIHEGLSTALPAAALGRVLVSAVVGFGLELALMQQGQQLGDLLQGRKRLLSPSGGRSSCFLPGRPPPAFL